MVNGFDGLAPEDARSSLDAASTATNRFVSRARAPWWYYSLWGALCGAIVASQALPATLIGYSALVWCFGVVGLSVFYRSITGVTIRVAAVRGMPYLILMIAILYVGIFASSIAAHSWDAAWFSIFAAVFVAALVTIIGYRWQLRAIARST